MLCVGTTILLVWNREFITVHVPSPFDLPQRNVISSHFYTVFRIFVSPPRRNNCYSDRGSSMHWLLFI